MTEITNVIRWNANFVRGLAQSVLERARVIRGSLTAGPSEWTKRKPKAKPKAKRAPAGRKPARSRSKKTNA